MQDATNFSGSIPSIYDEDLGPLLFHWSAERLAAAVSVPADGRVLEIACGTGIATAALREALPATVEIVATDLNDAMLAEARTRRGGLENVTYSVADAQELPYEAASFDAVVCQYGLMFFPDKVGALKEARRVLRPGGQLLFSVWDSLEQNPIVRTVHETFAEMFPVDPPRFLELPFGLYDRPVLSALFADAGAQDIEIETWAHTAELPSAESPAHGLVCGNPSVHEIAARDGPSVTEVVAAATASIRSGFGDEPVRAKLQAILVSARSS